MRPEIDGFSQTELMLVDGYTTYGQIDHLCG